MRFDFFQYEKPMPKTNTHSYQKMSFDQYFDTKQLLEDYLPIDILDIIFSFLEKKERTLQSYTSKRINNCYRTFSDYQRLSN